jgi:hypothetical protein
MKFCNKCGTTKDLSDFYAKGHCIECQRAIGNSYRTENRQSAIARAAKWRQENPDRARANNAEYYAKNRDKVLSKQRKWHGENPGYSEQRRSGGRDANKPWPRDEVGYYGAHSRITAVRGTANTYACPCGNPAEEWAYDHLDTDEFSGPIRDARTDLTRVLSWSAKPDHYIAMCHPCHVSFDKQNKKRETK